MRSQRLILGLLTIGLVLASWAFDATAGSISLDFGTPRQQTTTAAQDQALAVILARVNAQRVAQGTPPFPDVEAYLLSLLVGTVQSFVRQAREWERDEACTAFAALTGPQQTTITTSLGGRSPCP
jgi:hypothetical protein